MTPANNSASMTPAKHDGTSSAMSAEGHSTHRSAMARPAKAMHGKTDASQDAAVDQLNQQSYQSAQQGQAFSAGGSDSHSSGMTKPSGASSGDMSSGAMPKPTSSK